MTAALPPIDPSAPGEEERRLRTELAGLDDLRQRAIDKNEQLRAERDQLERERNRLERERDQARAIAVELEQENARLTAIVGHLITNPLNEITHHVWTSDLNALMGGSLDLRDDGVWTVLQFTGPGVAA